MRFAYEFSSIVYSITIIINKPFDPTVVVAHSQLNRRNYFDWHEFDPFLLFFLSMAIVKYTHRWIVIVWLIAKWQKFASFSSEAFRIFLLFLWLVGLCVHPDGHCCVGEPNDRKI
jgi:hypothetical protein